MPRTSTRAEPAYGELVSQYLALREDHPGVLLLFRVGSFYEVLFDDAELVARELGLCADIVGAIPSHLATSRTSRLTRFKSRSPVEAVSPEQQYAALVLQGTGPATIVYERVY